MIALDVYELKSLLASCSRFQRAAIDLSMYYLAFRPKHSYIVTSKHGLLAHGSIKQWNSRSESTPLILMFGFVYVRPDYRKFGIGELLTNYLLKVNADDSNIIHANIPLEHLPFYVRYGFQASFSLIGLFGKLTEFFDLKSLFEEEIIIQLLELSDILDLAAYDRQIYPTYRIQYFEQLREHTYSIAGYVAYTKKSKKIVGYVVLNFCQDFIKCGPLFADNVNIALLLLRKCASDYDGTMLLSVPEDNRLAVKLFETRHFKRTDTLHRVYRGEENIFREQTFERVWTMTDDWLSLI